jgi:hypothetical protein
MKFQAMKIYGKMEVELLAFLTPTIDGGTWLALCTSPLTPKEKPTLLTGQKPMWAPEYF